MTGTAMKRCISLLALAAVLQGCATAPPTTESLNSIKICCSSYATLHYDLLQAGHDAAIKITDQSPVYKFPEGKSHFAAFRLDPADHPRSIEVDIDLSSSWLPAATVFIPSFVFLDKDKQETRAVSDIQIEQRENFWTGGYYSVQEMAKPEEQYVVIYTNPKVVGQTIPFQNNSSGYMFMAGSAPVYVPGGSSTHQLPRNTIGALTIKLSN